MSFILKTEALENFGVSGTLMPSSHMVQFLWTTVVGVGVTGTEVGGRKQNSFLSKKPFSMCSSGSKPDSQGLHNNSTSVKREKDNWKTAGHTPLKSILGKICAYSKYVGVKSLMFVK